MLRKLIMTDFCRYIKDRGFTNLSIKNKMKLTNIFILSVMLFIYILGINIIYSIHIQTRQIGDTTYIRLDQLRKVDGYISKYCTMEKDYIISTDLYDKRSMGAEMGKLLMVIQTEWMEYSVGNEYQIMERYINEFEKNWSMFLKLDKRVLKLSSKTGDINQAIDINAIFKSNNLVRGQSIYLTALLDKLVQMHRDEYRQQMEKMNTRQESIILILFILTLFVFGIDIFISIMFANKATAPVVELTLLMKEVEKGNLDIKCKINRNDELGILSKGFNSMVAQINNLINTLISEQEQKRLAEIKILQHQINPHFLYHTLNSIRWMSKIYKAKNIDVMVTSLIKLLKSTISNNDEYITINSEIELLQCYFEIQKFRFLDKFETQFIIDDEIKDCRIIKLLLQPIVENSLFHGIECMKQKGRIVISGSKVGEDIILIIDDNGVGMDEKMSELILEANHSTNQDSKGIGLKNVNDRIKLHFGEKYGLKIQSKQKVGTRVEVKIPAI